MELTVNLCQPAIVSCYFSVLLLLLLLLLLL